MSKNKNQIILVICGLIMVGVIIYTIVAGNNFLPTENVWNKNDDNSSNEAKEYNKTYDDSKSEGMSFGDSEEVKKDQGISIGDEFQITDLIYKINSVERTKEKKVYSMPPPDLPFNTVDENGKIVEEDFLSVDENGTILNAYSYLVVNLTIKNTRDRINIKPLNSISLEVYDDKDKSIDGSLPFLNDREVDQEGKKDYFLYEFRPQEEREVTLVYIIKDKYLDYNNLKLRIENIGVVEEDFKESDRIKYIKIKY